MIWIQKKRNRGRTREVSIVILPRKEGGRNTFLSERIFRRVKFFCFVKYISLWESSEMMTVNQIMEELRKKGTIWANRTILVFLNNLEKKEAVSKQKQKITYYYYPIIAKKDFVKKESKNFLKKYFSKQVVKQCVGQESTRNLSLLA